MTLDPHAIHVFTDGSCFRNPGGPSGCAARAEFPERLQRGEELIVDMGYRSSTNNRMEVLACIHAIRWLSESGLWREVTRAQIVTDSKYVKNGVVFARGWRRSNATNRDGEPKENWDLWKELLRLMVQIKMRVDSVWMHDKESAVLLRVHHDAKSAARRGGPHVDSGYTPGWITRSMFRGSATRFLATGQIAVVRPYRKKRMKNREWKIRFDAVSEDGGSYVASYYAYASPELTLLELHSQNGYRVRFNADPKHPRILEVLEKAELPGRPVRSR